MKRKEKEILKNLSVDELKAELRQSKEKFFRLKFQRSSTPLANSLELRYLGRKVAMIKTWMRQRQNQATAVGRQEMKAKG